jgi:hypothetical protein
MALVQFMLLLDGSMPPFNADAAVGDIYCAIRRQAARSPAAAVHWRHVGHHVLVRVGEQSLHGPGRLVLDSSRSRGYITCAIRSWVASCRRLCNRVPRELSAVLVVLPHDGGYSVMTATSMKSDGNGLWNVLVQLRIAGEPGVNPRELRGEPAGTQR